MINIFCSLDFNANNYFFIFYNNLIYSLNNLHKTLTKSVLFRLSIGFLVLLLSFFNINSYYIPLVLCILVLLSFYFSKNKILFIINLIFIIIFWNLVSEIASLYSFYSYCSDSLIGNLTFMLTSFFYYYGEFLNPFDFYSNKNPKEYEDTLKFLENLIKNKFNHNPEDPNFSIFNDDSDENEESENIFLYFPDIYKKQAVHKEPYGLFSKWIKEQPDWTLRDKDGKIVLNEDLNKYLDHHNSNLEYTRNNPCKVEQFKTELDNQDFWWNIFWGGGYKSEISSLINKSNDPDGLLFHSRNKIIVNFQNYNFFLGAHYWYVTENKSSLPIGCEEFFNLIKHGNSWAIKLNIDLLKDYQLLVDSDLYPEKIHNYKNYMDDSKTYEEIGDNLLCTGFTTLFWYYIEQYIISELKENPQMSYEELIFKLENYSNNICGQDDLNLLYSLYKENYKNYEWDTKVDSNWIEINKFLKKFKYISACTKEDILSVKHIGLITDYQYKEGDDTSPLSLLYDTPHVIKKNFTINNIKYIFEIIYKSPSEIPLPEETLEENLYFKSPSEIPLPEVTPDEETFLRNTDVTESTDKNSIGEEFLSDCLEGNLFPEGY